MNSTRMIRIETRVNSNYKVKDLDRNLLVFCQERALRSRKLTPFMIVIRSWQIQKLF